MTTPPQCYLQAAELEITQDPDGYVVFDPLRRRVHHLNMTAALVLEACNGSIGVDEMAGLLAPLRMRTTVAPGAAESDADRVASVHLDLVQCLEALLREGLIRAVQAPS